MVKRRGLADMLRTEAQQLQETLEDTDSVSTEGTESQSLSGRQVISADFVRNGTPATESVSSEHIESVVLEDTNSVSLRDTVPVSLEGTDSVSMPKYLRLVRKEARLHEAQYDELTQLARELNRKKREVGEIITANTLLRVATELLLRRRSELRGDTEDELLSSLK